MTDRTLSEALAQYRERSLENVRRKGPVVAQWLRAAGIAMVEVDYDGCGDSGQLEEPRLLDAGGTLIALEQVDALHRQMLMDLLYDLIEIRHAGWENNDGASGQFTWNLATDELIQVHHERYTDYHTTEHHGL